MNQTVIDTTKTASEIRPGMTYRYTIPWTGAGKQIVDVAIEHAIPLDGGYVLLVGRTPRRGGDRFPSGEANWYDELSVDDAVTVLYSEEA